MKGIGQELWHQIEKQNKVMELLFEDQGNLCIKLEELQKGAYI